MLRDAVQNPAKSSMQISKIHFSLKILSSSIRDSRYMSTYISQDWGNFVRRSTSGRWENNSNGENKGVLYYLASWWAWKVEALRANILIRWSYICGVDDLCVISMVCKEYCQTQQATGCRHAVPTYDTPTDMLVFFFFNFLFAPY